jgi:hypothetical protein
MGISKTVLHPDRLWMQVVTWPVVSVLLGLGIGSGIGVLSMTPPLFLVAKICFIGSAVILWLKTIHWLLTSKATRAERMILAFLIFGASGMLLVEAVRWITRNESVRAATQSLSPAPATQDGKIIDERQRRLSEQQKDQLIKILTPHSKAGQSSGEVRIRYLFHDNEAATFAGDFREVFSVIGWHHGSERVDYRENVPDGLSIAVKWNEVPPPTARILADALKQIGLNVKMINTNAILREDDIALILGKNIGR